MGVSRKMLCGANCGLGIGRSDEYVTCAGICKQEFHVKCTDIHKVHSLYDTMKKLRTVVYKCDHCIHGDKQMINVFEKLMTEFKKNELKNDERYKLLNLRLDKIDNAFSTSKKCVTEEIVRMNESVVESEKNLRIEIAKVVEEKNNCEISKWNEVVKKKPKKKADPVVVIKPINADINRVDVKKSLKKNVDPTKFNVKGIVNIADNGVVIRCDNNETQEKLISEVVKNMGNEFTAKKPEKINPRVKILRVVNPEVDDDDFIAQLKKQNDILMNEAIKVVKRDAIYNKGIKDNDKFNVIIEINCETYQKIMNDKRLKHQWEVYRVVDHIAIKRCFKCLGFNHIASKCTKRQACANCAGEHKTNECSSTIKKCINCVSKNKKLNIGLDENHNVWDKSCKVYQRSLTVSKRAIHYEE